MKGRRKAAEPGANPLLLTWGWGPRPCGRSADLKLSGAVKQVEAEGKGPMPSKLTARHSNIPKEDNRCHRRPQINPERAGKGVR